MDGKVDWMANGLPVEGKDGPFIGGIVEDVPTCDVGATVADARRLLDGAGPEETVIVLAGSGLAVGEVDRESLDGRADDDRLLDVMDPGPSTYRPSVTVESMAEQGGGRWLVSTPDGKLLGVAVVEGEHDHDEHDHHDHDHDDHDHGEQSDEFDRELAEVMEAIEERFGDREPSEGELRAFLHARLVAEGRSAEDADRFLDQLETGED